ncbi:MAG: VCBS repeat-containing protein [Planctomycetota bacterium]
MHALLLTALAAATLALNGQGQAQLSALGDVRPRLPGRPGSGLGAAIAELDGRPGLDLVRLTSEGLEVLGQEPNGAFVRRSAPLALPIPGASRVVSLEVVHSIGRALPGVVVGLSGSDSLLVLNDGSGQLSQSLASPFVRPSGFSGATSQVLVGDVDGGGDDVIVLHDGAAPQLFSQGPAGFQLTSGLPGTLLPQAPGGRLTDVDGDRDLDLLLVQRASPSRAPVLLRNRGNGVFDPVPGAFAGWVSFAVGALQTGDVDGDGADDLVLAPTGAGRLRVLLNDGTGMFAAATVQPGFGVDAVADLLVAPLDGTGSADLAVLQQDGALLVSPGAAGVFAGVAQRLGPPPRARLLAADLEGDGDLDLYTLGVETEDRLLLGNGVGRWFDTASVTTPLGPQPAAAALALVDLTGEGDPDVAGFSANGTPIELINDGSARFAALPGRLPALGGAQVRDVQRISVSQPRAEELAVLASPPGGAASLRILVRRGAVLVDDTATRLPGPTLSPGIVAFVAGSARSLLTSSSGSDVIVVDDVGAMHLLVNSGGVLVPAPGAFSGTFVAGATKVLLGDIDDDRLPDVVVLRVFGAPVVLRGNGRGDFAAVAQPSLGSTPAAAGVAADFDGDGQADLLLRSSPPAATLSFLRGQGGARFAPAPMPLAGLPADPSALLLLPDRFGPALLVGSAASADVLVRRRPAGGYGAPVALAPRGSRATVGFLGGDLDIDGDEDVVVVRRGHLPQVRLNGELQLAAVGGVTQIGRPAVVRQASRRSGVGVLLAGAQARFPLAPYGLLRLNPVGLVSVTPLPVGAAPGAVDLSIPTLPGLPVATAALQVAFLDTVAGAIRLSNLERLQLIDF